MDEYPDLVKLETRVAKVAKAFGCLFGALEHLARTASEEFGQGRRERMHGAPARSRPPVTPGEVLQAAFRKRSP